MSPRLGRTAYAVGLLFGVAPLWAAQQLPMVDLPQHLALISALHRLQDSTTLYPTVFAARGELTPYLGYYHLVSLLHWLLPLELANRLFLTLVVAGLPLSLAFLLRALGRPRWPSLLALPFSYGDSFGWGFINYLACLPLAVLACGCFVRALTTTQHRTRWALVHAAVLLSVLLMHVQGFLFLALALPWLLLTTRVEGGFRARLPALLSVLPAVAVFGGVGGGPAVGPGRGGGGRAVEGLGPPLLGEKPLLQTLRPKFGRAAARPGQPAARRLGPLGPVGRQRVVGGRRAGGGLGRPRDGARGRPGAAPGVGLGPARASALLLSALRHSRRHLLPQHPLRPPGRGPLRRRASALGRPGEAGLPLGRRRGGAGFGPSPVARLPRLRRRGRAAAPLRRPDAAPAARHGARLQPGHRRAQPPGVSPRRGGAGATARRHQQLQLRPHAALPLALPGRAPAQLPFRVAPGRLSLGKHGPGLLPLSSARAASGARLRCPPRPGRPRPRPRGGHRLAGAHPARAASRRRTR